MTSPEQPAAVRSHHKQPDAAPTPTEQRAPQPGQLSPDIGAYRGGPATPAQDDVPGYWFRNPRTGLLSKVPAYMSDTIERCMREGFSMEMDPAASGAPIKGVPTKPKGDQLGPGGSAGVVHIYHG